MKKLFITFMFVFLGSQASAWVSKEFIPSNVDTINVKIIDDAKEGCWTNISEVKRYAEDKLELAGHNVYRNKKDSFTGYRDYKLVIQIIANRTALIECYGAYRIMLYKINETKDITGIFTAGEKIMTFKGAKNVNQHILGFVSDFMEEVEDPQW